MAATKVELRDIKEALDESSRHNRRLLLFFLLFMLYALVIVAATTDVDLLVPESKVRLPILNIELPIFGFYIVASLLIIIFHFNLLFNLVEHSKKLQEWEKRRRNSERLLVFPFLFNFATGLERSGLSYYFLKIILWVITYFFPVIVLISIQIKFSAYHSFPMTFLHFATVLADTFMLFLYWHRISRPQLSAARYDHFNNVLRFHAEQGLLYPFARTFFFLRALFVSLFTGRFIQQIRRMPIFLVKRIRRILNRGVLRSLLRRAVAALETSSFWLLVAVSSANFAIVALLYRGTEDYLRYIHAFIPRLDIQQITLVSSPPSVEIIQRYLAMGKTEADAWREFAKGLNLKGRDLRFANFSQSSLLNADLSSARLEGARLWYTDFRGANLKWANLDGAYLGFADLREANLQYAYLRGANIDFANLRGVILQEAHLRGANLGSSIGQEGHLQGANLSFADLTGASLSSGNLDGANLDHAKLEGAIMTVASLRGATLRNANLQGAHVDGVQLYGSDISKAKLYCVDVTSMNVGGLLFNEINATTKVDWDELLENAGSWLPAIVRVDAGPIAGRWQERFDHGSTGFIGRIKEAKQRCANFQQTQLEDLESNRKEFIGIKKRLACEAPDIANAFFEQFFLEDNRWGYDFTAHLREIVVNYMRLNCPDILASIPPSVVSDVSATDSSHSVLGDKTRR